MRKSQVLFAIGAVGLSLGHFSPAAQIPIAVTGYNQQFTVSADGTVPVSATVDGGTNSSGYTFYQVGQNASALATGLPLGTVFTSASDPTTSYSLEGPDQHDAILANMGGVFTFVTPAAYSTLSLLTATGSASNNPMVGYTINYANGDTQVGSVKSPDWFFNSPVAIGAGGRVASNGTGYDAVTSPGNNPNLYQEDIGALTEPNEPILSVALDQASGGGNTVVYAISGTAATPEPASIGTLLIGSMGLLARRSRRAQRGDLL